MVDAPDLPWRKRHPVLSRVWLYALGAALVAGVLVLWSNRRDVDDADALAAKRAELNAIDIVFMTDPDGEGTLKVLDEKFADPDLPADMRGRVLRWRALALRKQNAHERVDAALEAADKLDLPPRERGALYLEWAEALTQRGEAKRALAVLARDGQIKDGPLGVLRARELAVATSEVEQGVEATARILEKALAALPRPAPNDPIDYVGGRPWTTAQAATVATQTLMKAVSNPSNVAPWVRLMAIAPDDLRAQLACSEGFMSSGRPQDAVSAWRRALAINSRAANGWADKSPMLQAVRDLNNH